MNLQNIKNAFKALRELGPTAVGLFAIYKLGLKVGWYKTQPSLIKESFSLVNFFPLLPKETFTQTLGNDGLKQLIKEADLIVSGKFRQFGAEPVEINLIQKQPLQHWTAYENGPHLSEDIKFTWEPARFGWAFTLGRAWHLTADEKYAASFWQYFEQFMAANPAFLGPNWMSAQEVALRLIAFAWSGQVFRASEHSTPERLETLAQAIAQHAERIPPTLLYARAQNNNHLLTEAAALYTAGLALPQHPQAEAWQKTGWAWLKWCFIHQIDVYGEYTQHSTNYHRLMLQTALWVQMLARHHGRNFPWLALENLSLATHWLYSMLDPISGQVPNLGANDGAYIFPLTSQPFQDYRPVLQASARAFMQYNLPIGTWDEMALWFNQPPNPKHFEPERYTGDYLYTSHSWAMLRAVRRFRSRPSHADQLHLDLWWRGLNITRDAGTYLYNAESPWDNRLTATQVHNTVSVDGFEQMTRVSRFLYLDWAGASLKRQIENEAGSAQALLARTYAYAKLNVRHERSVSAVDANHWLIKDDLLNLKLNPHIFRLHWLFPDWQWKLTEETQGCQLLIKSPQGWVNVLIKIQTRDNPKVKISLVRAAEYVYGEGLIDPVRGYESPTYSVLNPALSLAIEVESADNVLFNTEFIFPT